MSELLGRSSRVPQQKQAISRAGKRLKFTPEHKRLVKLKQEGLTWNEIAEHFPARSKAVLQVRYCTKLKQEPGRTKKQYRQESRAKVGPKPHVARVRGT
jgi:hypothetical protein